MDKPEKSSKWNLLGVVIFFLIIWGIMGAIFGGESEGIVKYDDCRQVITIEQNDWQNNFRKFICNTVKSKSGKVIFGTCVHIDTEAGVCKTAYIYSKAPVIKCKGDNVYPDSNDNCVCNPGYIADTTGVCVLPKPTSSPQ